LAILARSFHLDTARLIPRPRRCKQAPLWLTFVVLILAGCGGSGAPKAQWQVVRGPTFRFDAPKGWQVRSAGTRAVATHDSELVQVATFPLVHAYSPALFTRVAEELASRMAGVARQTRGTVIGHSVVTAAGIRSHSYQVRVGDHVDEYTFVLRGKREYQLLCRRAAKSDRAACERLVASLSLA
jgi:hypothetical protein